MSLTVGQSGSAADGLAGELVNCMETGAWLGDTASEQDKAAPRGRGKRLRCSPAVWLGCSVLGQLQVNLLAQILGPTA